MCGQSANIHRDLRSIGHDVLHSVFHLDGKLWRTIPELALRPGRLTRRYIEGERAKFVSPMALFLFTVFAMYAVFAFAPVVDWNAPPPSAADVADSMEADAEALHRRIDSSSDGAEGQGGHALSRALQKLEDDPDLVLYKMKSNGYKWSWLLVPLSIPFVWVLFFWRREFGLFDHAVFVTYSIGFMMILLILSTLASMAGADSRLSALLLMLVPPAHLYSHLRGAYRLSRGAALVRLLFVLLAAAVVLSLFVTMLLLTGALD